MDFEPIDEGEARQRVYRDNIRKCFEMFGLATALKWYKDHPTQAQFNALHRLVNPHWAGSELLAKEKAQKIKHNKEEHHGTVLRHSGRTSSNEDRNGRSDQETSPISE